MSEQMFVSCCRECCPPDSSIEVFFPYVTNILYIHKTRENARKYIGEYAKWLVNLYNNDYKEKSKFSFYYDNDDENEDSNTVYIINEDKGVTTDIIWFEEVTIRDENDG